MIFEFGTIKVDVDVERTRRFYETVEDQLGCECAGCRNFRNAYPLLPDAVQAFFPQFGVDIGKPAEMTAFNSYDGNLTLYDGFYHICGTILEGREPFIQVAEGAFQLELDKSNKINLTPDHFVYFTSKCGLVNEDFPTPVIQLEIQGNIPWVLNEPNPYFYPGP